MVLALGGALAWGLRLAAPHLDRLRGKPAVSRVEVPPQGPARTPGRALVLAERARYGFAIYHLPQPKSDPRAALERLLPGFPGLEATRATVTVPKIEISSYAPPELATLKHSGRGLSESQARDLQESKSVFGLDFSYRPSEGYGVLRDSGALLLALARETGGLLWDEETRETFSPEEWERARVETWESGLPDVTRHITIHLYRNGTFLRAVTLGMAKFGLPDVVVNDLTASNSRAIGSLINLACQTLVERGGLDANGALPVNVSELKVRAVRDTLTKGYGKGARGRAVLTLVEGVKERGDAANPLLEISFPRPASVHLQEEHDAVTASVFGATDSITHVEHDEELLAASRAQTAKLPALAALFREGLAPGEHILLKAPFSTDAGGNEWMWVEVIGWKGGEVEGILQNDPFEVAGLKAGARVRFSDAVVFDFIHYFPDGRQEGNETGKIMLRRESAKKAG
ncbi:MAG: DUF2314 domain-containing protein [Thermoanaerobaculia bacterium]